MEDGIGGSNPDKGMTVCVVVGDEVSNAVNEIFDAPEGAAADRLLGDQIKPDLHLV